MYVDLIVLVNDTYGNFVLIPLLYTLEGQHTHLNGIDVFDQYTTE